MTRPSRQVGASASVLTAILAASLLSALTRQRLVRADVGDQSLELRALPAASHRRHVALELRRVLALLDEVPERLAVRHGAVPLDGRPDVALALETVALGADVLPRLLSEGCRHLLALAPLPGGEPLLELALRDDAHVGGHERVVEAAELGAAALVRPLAGRAEAEDVVATGYGVLLPRQLRNPPAVVDVEGGDLELGEPLDREVEGVEGDSAVVVLVLPVELVRLDSHLQRVFVARVARGLHRRDADEDHDGDGDQDERRDDRPDDLEPRV